jgi:hypothetical protein
MGTEPVAELDMLVQAQEIECSIVDATNIEGEVRQVIKPHQWFGYLTALEADPLLDPAKGVGSSPQELF